MILNSKQFKSAIQTLAQLPGQLPKGALVQFGNGKLTRTTFEAHCEVTLEGADEPILMDVNWLRKLDPPGETLQIITKDQHFLKSGNFSAKRNISTDEPLKAPEPLGTGVKVDLPIGAIKTVLAASARAGDGRPALEGMIFHGKDGKLLLAGTAGVRLHGVELGESAFDGLILVPTSFANIIPEGSTVTIYENCVKSVKDDTTMIVPISSERVPPVRAVIPIESRIVASADRDALMGAIQRVNSQSGQTLFRLVVKEDHLWVASGEENAEEIVPITSGESGYDAKANALHMLDALRSCPETVELREAKGIPAFYIEHQNLKFILIQSRIQ